MAFIVSGASSGAGRLILPTATELSVSVRRDGTDPQTRIVAISSGAAIVSVAFDDLATGTYTVAASAYVDPGTPLFVQTAEVELSPKTETLVLNLVPTNRETVSSATDLSIASLDLATGAGKTWYIPAGSILSEGSCFLIDGSIGDIHAFVQTLDGTLIQSGAGVPAVGTANAAGDDLYFTLYNAGSSSVTLKVFAGPAMALIPAGVESGMPTSTFLAGMHEVTQAQFRIVMGFNPSDSGNLGDTIPVLNVTWYDALSFCNKLSALLGLDQVYTLSSVVYDDAPYTTTIASASVSADFSRNGLRLPLDAERVWAARGGTSTVYYWGNAADDATVGMYACFSVNSGGLSAPIGGKAANAYGLYDMSGNAWEWGWGSNTSTIATPKRYGGARGNGAAELGSASYNDMFGNAGGSEGYLDNGFRVVRSSGGVREFGFIHTFESLTPGDLNGQDGWTTTIYPPGGYTPVDMQVSTSALPPNVSRVLSNDIEGANAGVDASRPLSLGEPIDLTNPDNTYRLTFDTVKTAWGTRIGFAYDENDDGLVTKDDLDELALLIEMNFDADTCTITRADGSTQIQSAAIVPDESWVRVQLILHSGTVTVRVDPGITGAWTTLWTDLSMGIDTGSSAKTNPALWDQLFIHMEGAGNKADNIRLEKIVAP